MNQGFRRLACAAVAATVLAAFAGCALVPDLRSPPTSFVATPEGSVLFLAWTVSDQGQITGTLQHTRAAATGSAEPLEAESFEVTGAIGDDDQVTLKLGSLFASTLHGSLDGTRLTLGFPSDSGGIDEVSFTAGDTEVYNSAVEQLRDKVNEERRVEAERAAGEKAAEDAAAELTRNRAHLEEGLANLATSALPDATQALAAAVDGVEEAVAYERQALAAAKDSACIDVDIAVDDVEIARDDVLVAKDDHQIAVDDARYAITQVRTLIKEVNALAEAIEAATGNRPATSATTGARAQLKAAEKAITETTSRTAELVGQAKTLVQEAQKQRSRAC